MATPGILEDYDLQYVVDVAMATTSLQLDESAATSTRRTQPLVSRAKLLQWLMICPPSQSSSLAPANIASMNASDPLQVRKQVLLESDSSSEQPTGGMKVLSPAENNPMPSADWEAYPWSNLIDCNMDMPKSDVLPLLNNMFQSAADSEPAGLLTAQHSGTEEKLPGLHMCSSFGRYEAFNTISETKSEGSKKARLRWTSQLHDKFVAVVAELGGSNRATPKTIHRLMDCNNVTICHVKSHLQKYRLLPAEPTAESRSERKRRTSRLAALSAAKIPQAYQMQMEVQLTTIHEHLQILRQMQMRCEEQDADMKRSIKVQVKVGEVLGIPAEQIASGEFFARAIKDLTFSISAAPSADPAPQTKRPRVDVP